MLVMIGAAGCNNNTIYTFNMPSAHTTSMQRTLPVDLSPFWIAKGFTLVERSSKTEVYDPYYSGDDRLFAARWEKWYNGTLFPYSGNIVAIEYFRGDRYGVLITPLQTRQREAAQIFTDLKKLLAKNYPDIPVNFSSRGFMDLR
jgi:hypothetical protein